jgi:two-component system, sensor histidine kinase and response regulator
MTPDALRTMFDKFTQADSSITRKYGGTGLGLEISQRLVERMGGVLTGTSEVGQGSTFRFNAKFKRGIQGLRKPVLPAPDFHGHRILVRSSTSNRRDIEPRSPHWCSWRPCDFA